MVTAKQIAALAQMIEATVLCMQGHGYDGEKHPDVIDARKALAAIRSDYRAARLARRQAVSAPRRALQRVGAK